IRKAEFYNLHSDLCKAIFNPKRLAIIDVLRNNRMNVSDLSEKLKTSQSNISQHLAILKSKSLVVSIKEGSNTYYSISNPKILKAYDLVSEIIKNKFKSDNKILNEMIKQ
ncbi:unnamed protein product, partial [marine sediment metagenome]